MRRYSLLLCLACVNLPGCVSFSLPRLPTQGTWQVKAVVEENRLVAPADQAEQLLERAAAQLAQGQELAAVTLLEEYLNYEPRHLFIRAQVGELLFRQQKWAAARQHFQWCVGLAQEFGHPAYKYLIHAHSRLVDIAEAEENAFAEHLHRGIGLYELACHREKEAEPISPAELTSIFGRSLLSLQDARSADPTAARPHWYLYLVWSRLGQYAAARRSLEEADQRKFFAELTPSERRQMQTACWWEGQFDAGIRGPGPIR